MLMLSRSFLIVYSQPLGRAHELDERCKNQEAAMEFPHPHVGGPLPGWITERAHSPLLTLLPPSLPAMPSNFHSLSLYFHLY